MCNFSDRFCLWFDQIKSRILLFIVQTSFLTFDRDRSGTIDPQELNQALVSFQYRLSPQVMGVLLRRYSTDGRVTFDSFVALCVRLRSYTSECIRPGPAVGREGGGVVL